MDIFIFFNVKDKSLHISGIPHAGVKCLHKGNDDIHIIDYLIFTDIIWRNMGPGIPDSLHSPDISALLIIDKKSTR